MPLFERNAITDRLQELNGICLDTQIVTTKALNAMYRKMLKYVKVTTATCNTTRHTAIKWCALACYIRKYQRWKVRLNKGYVQIFPEKFLKKCGKKGEGEKVDEEGREGGIKA